MADLKVEADAEFWAKEAENRERSGKTRTRDSILVVNDESEGKSEVCPAV